MTTSVTPESLENCPTMATESANMALLETAKTTVETKKDSDTEICVICTDFIKNKSYPENCKHFFCFECLSKWGKQEMRSHQSAVCPLCKKAFTTIFHNLKANNKFDKWEIPLESSEMGFPFMGFRSESSPDRRQYTYQATLQATLEQNEAIHEFFGHPNILDYTRFTPQEWRRYIYENNLYSSPLPDLTGRFRPCNSRFYRENPTQTHRLITWLNRELVALMPARQANHIPDILETMRNLLTLHHIKSPDMKSYFQTYLHGYTEHFIHEFYNYASSPFDMNGYDRIVSYSRRPELPNAIVISSSDSEDMPTAEDLSDNVVVVETYANNNRNSVVLVSSRDELNSTNDPTNTSSSNANQEALYRNGIVQITRATSPAVVESSSTDSECEYVLSLKPPHLRTPEQVTLDSASDSDVIFVDCIESNVQNANDSKQMYTLPNRHDEMESADDDDNESDNEPLSLKIEPPPPLPQSQDLKRELTEEPRCIIELKTGCNNYNILNYGASTSTTQDSNGTAVTRMSLRRALERKSLNHLFDESSTSDFSSFGSSTCSDFEYTDKRRRQRKDSSKSSSRSSKSQKKRKSKRSRRHKKRKSEITNDVPLSNENDIDNDLVETPPQSISPSIFETLQRSSSSKRGNRKTTKVIKKRKKPQKVKTVIIKKFKDDQHYIENPDKIFSSSSSD